LLCCRGDIDASDYKGDYEAYDYETGEEYEPGAKDRPYYGGGGGSGGQYVMGVAKGSADTYTFA